MKPETPSDRRPEAGGAIPEEAIRGALDKILASQGFRSSERLGRFLSFTVHEALAGNADKIKESMLGVEVFGRRPTYDPRMDAVVRTEAVKLRARLKEYYETAGREDEVRIDLPKGAYIPLFSRRVVEPAAPRATPAGVAAAHSRSKAFLAGAAAVLLLAGAFFAFRAARKGPRPPGLSSVAVLPFSDLSPLKDQEYFCDGMTDEIIDALTKAGGFRVAARTSSFAFKGRRADIREIGRVLNVSAVLEGSVRKDGKRLRVTAQLIGVSDGYHLWSETYERELKDVFALQDEISRSIVNAMQVKLAKPLGGDGARPANRDLETYDLYLKGRYHWGRWREDGAQKALSAFEQAIARDPNYAGAYAGLADSYSWLAFFGAMPPNEAMPKARAAAEKAIALDSGLAEAHISLGYVRALYDWDWAGARSEFERGIALNPNLADGHFALAMVYLAPLGRFDEAIREMQRAHDLDPLSLVIDSYLGLLYSFRGDTDRALAQYRKALELDPSFAEARIGLFECCLARRDPAAAPREIANLRGVLPEPRLQLMTAMAFIEEGKREEARALVRSAERNARTGEVRFTAIAGAYMRLGDKAAALDWLDKAYAERDGSLAFLNCSSPFGALRTEPRFRALLAKLGLGG